MGNGSHTSNSASQPGRCLCCPRLDASYQPMRPRWPPREIHTRSRPGPGSVFSRCRRRCARCRYTPRTGRCANLAGGGRTCTGVTPPLAPVPYQTVERNGTQYKRWLQMIIAISYFAIFGPPPPSSTPLAIPPSSVGAIYAMLGNAPSVPRKPSGRVLRPCAGSKTQLHAGPGAQNWEHCGLMKESS